MGLVATIRALIATSSNIAAPSVTISQPGGWVGVLIQVNTDDDVRRFAGELEVSVQHVLLSAETTSSRVPVEYYVADKHLDGLRIRVMGPHHELVRRGEAA